MSDNETNDQDTLTDLYSERVENFLKEQIFYKYWYGEPILDFVDSDGEFEDDPDDSDYYPTDSDESDYDSEEESYHSERFKRIKTQIGNSDTE